MYKTLAVLLLTTSAFAAGLTGKWAGTFEELNPDGSVRRSSTAYMDLTLDDETVTGSVGPDPANGLPVRNGKLVGTKLTFEFQQEELGAKFDLVFDGATIRGTVALTRNNESRSARVALKPVADGPPEAGANAPRPSLKNAGFPAGEKPA